MRAALLTFIGCAHTEPQSPEVLVDFGSRQVPWVWGADVCAEAPRSVAVRFDGAAHALLEFDLALGLADPEALPPDCPSLEALQNDAQRATYQAQRCALAEHPESGPATRQLLSLLALTRTRVSQCQGWAETLSQQSKRKRWQEQQAMRMSLAREKTCRRTSPPRPVLYYAVELADGLREYSFCDGFRVQLRNGQDPTLVPPPETTQKRLRLAHRPTYFSQAQRMQAAAIDRAP